MSDRINEFLKDLRLNWDDHYWWARHQALLAAVTAIVTGVVGLLFTYLQARVAAAASRERA
ncbi:MAG TPA: hypothetical protein VFP55_13685 [Solirubrobacteraceae bacterium]|nr:hypothetical protein [Solirubrobacteraceae bacterium]